MVVSKKGNKDFEECRIFGELGQKLFQESKAWKILFPNETKIEPVIDKEGKHHKGDFKIANKYLEIKTRTPKYAKLCGKDILIEISNTNQGKELFKAWINKYSEDTYLVYQWTQLKNNKIELIKHIVIFKPIYLKNHLEWLNSHELKFSKNQEYDTNFVIISINELSKKIPLEVITWI